MLGKRLLKPASANIKPFYRLVSYILISLLSRNTLFIPLSKDKYQNNLHETLLLGQNQISFCILRLYFVSER